MGCLVETSPVRTATSSFPELVIEINLGFGPDAVGGAWCDITPFVMHGRTERGRSHEADQFEAGTLALTLAVNPAEFPGRLFDQEWAAGPFYPYLLPMRAVRVSAMWGESTLTGLVLDGTSGCDASTPDSPAWAVSGVLRVAGRVRASDFSGAAGQQILNQWTATGNQRAWMFRFATSGALEFILSADGTTTAVAQASSAPSFVDGTTYWVGVEYNTATGALSFYQAADAQTMPSVWGGWTLISSHSVAAATPFGSSAALRAGAQDAGTLGRLLGTIYRAALYDDGVLIADADFSPTGNAVAGSSSYTDSVGNVWAINGTAVISASTAGTYYPVFYGYVTSWGNVTPADNVMMSTVTARDAFVRLEQIKLPSSVWALEVLKDDPSAWFRLGETDTLRMTDSAGGNFGRYGDASIPGAEGLVANDDDGGAQFDHSPDVRCPIQNLNMITGYPFTLAVMCKLDNTDQSAFHTIFTVVSTITSPVGGLALAVTDSLAESDGNVYTGKVRSSVRSITGTNQRLCISNVAVNDDAPHFVCVDYASSSSHRIYVDGVEGTTVVEANNPTWPATMVASAFGNYPDALAAFGSFGFGNGFGPSGTTSDATRGILDEFVIYNGKSLSAERIAALSLAAMSGWSADDTGTRASRFLDAIEWPASLRDIDAGISKLGPANWSVGSSALSVMKGWADTELGQFFIGKSGEVVWRSRHYQYLDPKAVTSQATFGDTTSGVALRYVADGFTMPRDETLLRNPVTAQRTGGVIITVRDDALVEKFGDRSWVAPNSEDLLDASIRDRASYLLSRFKNPATRLAGMQLIPTTSAMWAQVLAREIGDRITIKRTPLGTGSEVSVDQIIERVVHDFTPEVWRTVITASPVDPNVGNFLILNDAVDGILDVNLLAY